MQLKVGGVYKARNGDRELIVGESVYLVKEFLGKSGLRYMHDGRNCVLRETSLDLIAEWKDDPAPEVGKWIRWDGGQRPVHPETIVSGVEDNGVSWSEAKAKHCDWQSFRGCYKIITPYVEPKKAREFWVLYGVDGMKDCVSDMPIKSPLAIHVREVLPDDE